MGSGIGFVYVTPLSTLLKWFPDNKGTITGLAVAVFGGGSILFKEVIAFFIQKTNVESAFLYLGLLSFTIILIGALLTSLPKHSESSHNQKTNSDYTSKEMMKTRVFYKTWLMYWLGVIPGLLLLGIATNLGLEHHLDLAHAVNLVTILALSNATSRIIMGSLADRFGVLFMIRITFIINIVSLSFILLAPNLLLFYIGIIGVAIGYGGFLTLFPTWTNQRFGSYRYGSNYGIIFQAYGIAAISGIVINKISGSYNNTFFISILAGIIGLLLALNVKQKARSN
jgi:OFA family oxalate/formate antiporter-like MFS transporter